MHKNEDAFEAFPPKKPISSFPFNEEEHQDESWKLGSDIKENLKTISDDDASSSHNETPIKKEGFDYYHDCFELEDCNFGSQREDDGYNEEDFEVQYC